MPRDTTKHNGVRLKEIEADIADIKVSVIINTYNRYGSLQLSIESVKNQTHKNLEIIVINDKSSQKEYYENRRPEGVKWVDLEQSSREACGFPCLGYTRNAGISNATGEYIAVIDDDDYWMPEKIAIQLAAMISEGVDMCCTEAYIGESDYNPLKNYPLYYGDYFKKFAKNFFIKNYGNWPGALPHVFTLDLLSKHNFIIHSSVVLKKSILEKSGLYDLLPLGADYPEDIDLWLRVLKYTNCIYINEPLLYYDGRLSEELFVYKLKRKIRKLIKY